MKFKPQFKKLRLNLGKYRKALHKHMTKTLGQATEDWIRAATDTIPVWSGASVATFLPLLEKVKGATLTLHITPKRDAPNQIGLGKALSDASFVADPKGSYTFSYSTELPHLIYNEYNNANALSLEERFEIGVFSALITPGPYHFQEIAARRFITRASHASLPNPFEFFNG